MVLLNPPIPLNIINKINIIQASLGLQKYIIHLHKVDFTERIIGFLQKDGNKDKEQDKEQDKERDKEKDRDKDNTLFIVLWKNELDATPYQQLVTLHFRHVKYARSLEILQVRQLDKHNFVLFEPTSTNRYVYNLNTFLFKEYEIIPGQLYYLCANSNTEMVYYNDS
jgi:hypothetical protein